MVATLPKAEKPDIRWIMQCVQLSLQAVRNRLHWDDPVSFSDDDTARVELHHVGLGVVNLDAMPLHRVVPHEMCELAPAQLEHMTPEQLEVALPKEEEGPLTFSGDEHEPGMLSLLQARGVNDPVLEYPYRDDALGLWHAIEEWVTTYVNLYYRSDEEGRADRALQEWAAEIVSQDGARIPGFGDAGDGRIQSLAYLCRALTLIVFTASAQHAAVNAPQAGLMNYAPATPPAAYCAAPASSSDSGNNGYLDYFPPLKMAVLQMEFMHLLGGVVHTRLGRYERSWFKDAKVREPLARFQSKLEELEALSTERNRTRLGPYPFLLPSRVPQSINI